VRRPGYARVLAGRGIHGMESIGSGGAGPGKLRWGRIGIKVYLGKTIGRACSHRAGSSRSQVIDDDLQAIRSIVQVDYQFVARAHLKGKSRKDSKFVIEIEVQRIGG